MILHEVQMVFPSCVLTLFTSWWLQTLPPTYLGNLDPGLWPDPIGVWRLAQWNQRNEKTTGPFASGDAVGILLINLVFWEESLGSFDLHLHQMIPPILSRLSYVHGLAHAFAGFIEPQHFEVLSSRIAQVCLAWRTKKTTPESSDAVMLVDDWWFQFVVFTSNIPTNHPFLVAKRPLSSHNAYSFSRQRFCYLAQFGWDKNKWGDGKSQIGKLQETCFWRQKYTQISPVPWFCWWE